MDMLHFEPAFGSATQGLREPQRHLRANRTSSANDSRQSRRSDTEAFQRGINSFQLLNDGTRWWVVSIYWQAEGPDFPIPERYIGTIGDPPPTTDGGHP